MSLFQTITHGMVYSSLGNMAVKAFSVVSYLVVLSLLTSHDYGIFVLVVAIAAPATAFVFFGFDRLFVSNLARARGRKNHQEAWGLTFEYYRAVAVLFAILAIVLVVGRYVVNEWYDIYFLRYFWPLVFFESGQLLLNGSMLLLESHEKFKHLAVTRTTEALVRSMLIVVLAAYLSVELVIVVYGLAKFAAATYAVYHNRRIIRALRHNAKKSRSTGVLIGIIRSYGKWELGRNIIEQTLGPLKLWLIKIFVNVETVAAYDIAQKLYSLVMNTFPVKTVVFPLVSRTSHQPKTAQLIVMKAKKYALAYYVAAFAGLVIGLPFALDLLAPQYGSYLALMYLVVGHVFIQVYSIGQSPLMYAFNQQKYLVQIYPLTYAFDVASVVVLTYYFGAFGSAWAWHLSTLMVAVLLHARLRQLLPVALWNWRAFFSFDGHDRMLFGAIGRRLAIIFSKFTMFARNHR